MQDISEKFNDISLDGNQSLRYLENFYEDQSSYSYIQQILSSQKSPTILKVIAIKMIEKYIFKQWNKYSGKERDNQRLYLINLVSSLSSNQDTNPQLLIKADFALVTLLIHKFPATIPTFFQNTLKIEGKTDSLIINDIQIIKLFYEEVFENENLKITDVNLTKLSNLLRKESNSVFRILTTIFSTKENVQLNKICLSMLKKIIPLVDPNEIISSQLLQKLCKTFLPSICYINDVLSIFSCIFDDNQQLVEKSSYIASCLLNYMVMYIGNFIDKKINLEFDYQGSFIFSRQLSIALTVFLEKFAPFIETPNNVETIQKVLLWLLLLTKIDDIDVIQTCCEFWLMLTRRFREENKNKEPSALTVIYAPVFPHVRSCLMKMMPLPFDIIYEQDSSGNILLTELQDSQELMIHELMKECLINLTLIDPDDTIAAFQASLDELVKNFNSKQFNKLCWCVGAISKVIDSEKEEKFITKILNTLFEIGQKDKLKGKVNDEVDNEVNVIWGTAFICSCYAHFLEKFPVFLKKTVLKLLESMKCENQDTKIMSVFMFSKIARECFKILLMTMEGSDKPFINEIIQTYPSIVSNLSSDLIILLFDSLSFVISENQTKEAKLQDLGLLLKPLNQQLNDCENRNYQVNNPSNYMKRINFIIKCNASIAFNIGDDFTEQFSNIFPRIINIYLHIDSINSGSMYSYNSFDDHDYAIQVKASIIEVIKNYVLKSDYNTNYDIFVNTLQQVIDIIVNDFLNNPELAETDLFDLLLILASKFVNEIDQVSYMIFNSVLSQSEHFFSNTNENPSSAYRYFSFLEAIIKNHYQFIDGQYYDFISNILHYGFNHYSNKVCEISLEMFIFLVDNINNMPDFDQIFYIIKFSEIMSDIFFILRYTKDNSIFDLCVSALMKLLTKNVNYAKEQIIIRIVSSVFPDAQNEDILSFTSQLVLHFANSELFKIDIKDFLASV